jgi:pimeloyl-ACP methyl ester carboxylesterase
MPSPAEAHPDWPPGRLLDLRGRAPVFVREIPGPPGAPTVMLLHGLAASAALNWHTAFAPLGAHFHVIAPDHRGHGRTPAGPEPFTLTGCAADAFAVADALGVERVIPVGYSMGGPIAQLMWRAQPARVQGLVLAATSRDFGGRVRDRLLFGLLPLALAASAVPGYGLFRRSTLSFVAPRFATAADRAWVIDELARADSRAVIQATAELGRFTSRGWIDAVDVPTSVVVAMDDQLVPVRRQLKLARSIHGAVAAFANGDHYVAGRAETDFVSVLVHECRAVARRAAGVAPPDPSYWELLSS